MEQLDLTKYLLCEAIDIEYKDDSKHSFNDELIILKLGNSLKSEFTKFFNISKFSFFIF